MEIVCRICLKLVTSSCSEPIEEAAKDVLKVLLIDVDLSLSDNPVICLRCERCIGEFCDFKVMCIETEDLLQPYRRRKIDAEVDLKIVYLDSLTSQGTVCGSEIFRICRLCMKSKQSEYYPLSIEVLGRFGIEESFLEKFLPEVSLTSTKSPIICQRCLRLFINFAKFIMSRSKIEQKIIGYWKMTRIGTKGRINLGKIARFIKSVTPELIPSDEKEDLHFLQCIDDIKKAGIQGRMEERLLLKEENRCEKHEIAKNTATERLEEVAEQLSKDEPIRMGKKRLGAKTQAEEDPKPVAITLEETAKQAETRVSKIRKVGGNQGQQVRRKRLVEEQSHTGRPRSLLDPLQRQLIVLIEKLGNLKATQAESRRNRTSDPEIESKQTTSTGRQTFSYSECDFASKYKSNVRSHFDRKHQLMFCADCPFTTISRNALKVHISKHHKRYRCTFCPRTYVTRSAYYVHMNGKHAVSRKTYKCEQCDYESKYRSNAVNHAKIHSGGKTVYRCGSCSYSSNKVTNVRRHAVSHLDASEVEIFKCYQCNYDTRWKGNLIRHIYKHLKKHTELFRCSKCYFKTAYKASLVVHLGAHDKVVYRCEKCTYTTTNEGSWKMHESGTGKGAICDGLRKC